MKKQQGFVWAPLLIIIGGVVVAGFATYYMFQASKPDTENVNVAVVNQANNNSGTNFNTNSASNTNQVANTNTVVNTNAVSNTNTATDPTAGWKTYKNKEYKYSIDLPSNWTLVSAFDGKEIDPEQLAGSYNFFGIKARENSGKGFTIEVCTMGTVTDCAPNNTAQWRQNKDIEKEESVKLGEESFTRITLQNDPSVWYITEYGNYFYEVRIQEPTNAEIPQVLSTFQFTN